MADIAELGYSVRTGEIDRASTSLDRMSGSANRAAGSMGGMERNVVRAAASLAAMVVSVQALRSGIGTLAQYGQEMSTVRAVTQATSSQFAALSEEARRLGATTRFSASEAAQGMTFLARAGFSAEQALAATESTLTLAQAGALGLGQAADIASNVLTGFRLEVEQTGRVVDVLAFAANNSNTTVGQLGEAMSMVAPVAAGLGVSLEEAAAAVGALSDAGIQGTRAGTGLRRVLSTLESPTAQAQAILADLGLTTDQVRVSQVGLTQAMTALARAGIDTGTALELFGDRGGPAFEVLSSAIPRVTELNQALQGAAGTAERVAGVMDDNLNGALLAVRSASEEVILAFGDLSGTGLEDAARGIADALRFVAANAGTVATAASAGAVGFVAYRAALLASSAGAAQFTTALAGMTTGMGRALVATRALAAAKALLLGPLGIAILAATGAGIALASMGRSQAEQSRRAERAAQAQDAHNEAIRRADRLLEEHAHITRASSDADRDAIAARMGSRAAIIAYQDSLRGITPAAREAREAALAHMRAQAEQAEAAVAAAQANLELRRQIYGLAPRSELREEIQGLETDLITLTRAAEVARSVLARLAGQDVASFDPVTEMAARRLSEAERSLERNLQLANMRTDAEREVAQALWDAGLALDSQGEEAENIRRLATEIYRVTEARAAAEERIREAQAMAQRQQQSIADARERLSLLQIEDEGRRAIAEQMLRAGFAQDDQSGAAQEYRRILAEIVALQTANANEAGKAAALAQVMASAAQREAQIKIDAARALGELDTELGFETGGELARLQAQYEQRLDIIRTALEARHITEEEAARRRNAMQADYDSERNQLIAASAAAGFGSLAEIMRGTLGEQSAAYQAMFALSKGFAIAESVIAIQQAIAKAIAVGFPQNIPLMATAAAQGASIIQTITSTQPGFRSGGYTGNGPEHAVAGVVHGKEGVLNAGAMRGIGRQALDYMNRNQALPPSNDNGGGGGKPSVNIDMRGAMVTREAVEDLRRGLENLGYRVEMVDQSIPDRVRSTMVEDRERGIA